MAEIYTPLLLLLILVVGFGWRELCLHEKLIVIFFLCIAFSVHVTHIILGGIFGLVVFLTLVLRQTTINALRTFVTIYLFAFFSAATATSIYNGLFLNTYSISPAGQSIFLANLLQYGHAKEYLRESCLAKSYKLCPYLERMPIDADDFLWEKWNFSI